jgi:meiotically up-regulated gene 157 (Mug157) protein
VSESDELYTEDDYQVNNEYGRNKAISESNNFYTDGEYIWGVNSEHKVYFRYPISLLESVCI